ncbi:MAG: metallophosphoesterase family protein [Prosthecobacter sp.]
MPVHLTTESRRSFMVQLGGAVVSTSALQALPAEADRVDPDRIAILNDTHIGAGHTSNAPVPSHLRETVAWLVALERRPAAVVINGDLALSNGRPGDYEHFARLIAPLREAGIPVHLTLGNHDDRDVFHEVLKAEKQAQPPVVAKQVGVVSLPNANLFLLDSLKGPLVAQGLLGPAQISWLGRMLDAHADKPALVFAHHNPRLGGEERHFPGGLEDSETLWDLLVSRPHVKAYVHGHIHHRDFFQHRGIHIINTPATSFVSRPEESTTGWTMARLTEEGGEFTTFTHLRDHPWNRAVAKLAWRPT